MYLEAAFEKLSIATAEPLYVNVIPDTGAPLPKVSTLLVTESPPAVKFIPADIVIKNAFFAVAPTESVAVTVSQNVAAGAFA